MGFFFLQEQTVKRGTKQKRNAESLQRIGCAACTLNKAKVHSPKMQPTLADDSLIYFLGEAPGESEDLQGAPFVGKSGKFLRSCIPNNLLDHCSFDNVIRDYPGKNKDGDFNHPEFTQIECFPSNTQVLSIGNIKNSYRRRYEGPLITIVTTKGNVLTGTPNHPIFGVNGTTSLKELKIGDYVYSTLNSDFGTSARSPNRYYKPISINEIFNTFRITSEPERMGIGPFDFHGDVIANSDVDIVRANSQLLDKRHVIPIEKLKQFNFTSTNPIQSSLTCNGPLKFRDGILAMITSFNDFIGGLPGIPNFKVVSGISNSDSFTLEKFDNCCTPNIFSGRNIIRTLTRKIASNYISNWLPNITFPSNPTSALYTPNKHSTPDEMLFDGQDTSPSEIPKFHKASSFNVEL